MANQFNFAEALIKFVGDDRALKPQLAGIEKLVGNAATGMASVARTAMLGVTAAVAGIVAATGTLSVLVKLSANAGDEISKLSQRVAIGAETLSGYKLAAELADLSLQDLGTSLQKASRNIVEASRGTGEAAEAFERLGINVRDNAGKIKTAEQIMLEIADRFAKMEDGAEKTALAMDIFGKSGASLIPLLNQGSAAIAAQRKEAEQLGATWTTAQAKLAEEFNDNLTRIQTGLAGFRNTLAQELLPFLNTAVASIVAKMKEWSSSGELQIWALRTGEVIVGSFVKAAEAVASVARAAPLVVDTFRGVMAALQTINMLMVETAGGALNLIGKLAQASAWVSENLFPKPGALTSEAEQWKAAQQRGFAERLRDVQQFAEDWRATMLQASRQASDAAAGWWDGIGSSNEAAERFAGTIGKLGENFRAWAEKAFAAAAMAKAGATDAAKGVGEAAAKTAGQVGQSVKDQVKALDEGFKALKTHGEASLQDTLDWMQRRAALFRAGTPERNQAESEAFKFAKDMADRLFTHQQTLGLKSLQDAVNWEKQKAAAAKAGTEEALKAKEAAFQKEEELRNKARSAALGILGEVKERLEARGITEATQADVIREMQALQQERAAQITGTVGRFQAGGAVDIERLMEGFKNITSLEDFQKQLQQMGGPGGIFGQAGKIALGPLTEQLGLGVTSQTLKDLFAQGRGDLAEQLLSKFGPEGAGPISAGPLAGVGAGTQTEMDGAFEALDTGLNKMEARVQESGSRIRTTLFNNLEQWFVDKLMEQGGRN